VKESICLINANGYKVVEVCIDTCCHYNDGSRAIAVNQKLSVDQPAPPPPSLVRRPGPLIALMYCTL